MAIDRDLKTLKKGRLVPNINQGKGFFCVLVYCTGNRVYLATQHVISKSGLQLKILHSKVHLVRFLKILAPDIFTC